MAIRMRLSAAQTTLSDVDAKEDKTTKTILENIDSAFKTDSITSKTIYTPLCDHDTDLIDNRLSTSSAPLMHRALFSLRARKRIFRCSVKLVLLVILILYGVVPLGLYVFPGILKSLIFLTFVQKPLIVNYSDPEASGLPFTRNFYIKAEHEVLLGTWHVLPKSLMNSKSAKESSTDGADDVADIYELSLRNGLPIILYMHGNSGSRAAYHRVDLYQILRDLDAHVIAFDYRGYGDSSRVPVSEDALVRDGKAVYRWLRKRAGNSPIYVWGHSLGTGVSSRAVSELCQEGEPPRGLILEAPFNNMSEEVVAHPLSRLFRLAPWYHWAAIGALHYNNILFDSDKHVSGVTVPIVIFHAEDDNVIPVELGQKLYQATMDGRPKSAVSSMIIFDADLGYGHRYICHDPNLPTYVRRFINHPETKLEMLN